MTTVLDRLPDDFSLLSDEDLGKLTADLLQLQGRERQENQLRYYQPVSDKAKSVHLTTKKTICIGGGNGACLPLTEPILMANGTWKSLGDIHVGDMVMAADPMSREAIPSPVTNIFRAGKKEVFRVTFSDGGHFVASADHHVPLLLGSSRLTTKGNTKLPHQRRLGDYLNRFAARGVPKRISAVSPRDVVFTQTEPMTIPPYLLGALLGDGSLGKGTLKFSNTDKGVLRRVEQEIKPYELRLVPYSGCDYGLTGDGGPNLLKNDLIALRLWGCNSYSKFIPPHYLRADRKHRKALLAGLIDTDGGQGSYSTCSRRLADDFVFLVKSLGGKATCRPHRNTCQTGAMVDHFLIYWRLVEKLPLALPRKQVNTHARQIDYTKRVCRSVESLGEVECGDLEVNHPSHCYITGDWVIVSNSKTDTCLAEMVIRATGQIPLSLKDSYPREKLRGPIACRVVCESLTTTLVPIILPKLQWNLWRGVDMAGGQRGHWGWIPKACLIGGDWRKSWRDRERMLRLYYRDPDHPERIIGESVIQFMSFDQDPSDFASGDFHYILHDEPPPKAIWEENMARAMRVGGTMALAMTWPTDPAIPIDWIYDDLYEKAQPGVEHDDKILWLDLDTTENMNLDQNEVAERSSQWSKTVRDARIHGQPIRMANRVHPLFTDITKHWCFVCRDAVIPDAKNQCGACHNDLCAFTHVRPVKADSTYPVIFGLDPHPRKPHDLIWVQIDPNDDLALIECREVDGDPAAVWEIVKEVEQTYGWGTVRRLMDPNMGRSPSDTKREITWQDAFEQAGLVCDLAYDGEVGRRTLDSYLEPDEQTRQPRFLVDPRCTKPIYQMKRYLWGDFKVSQDRDQKQRPKQKHDDIPTLLKYIVNSQPTFRELKSMGQVFRREGRSAVGY